MLLGIILFFLRLNFIYATRLESHSLFLFDCITMITAPLMKNWICVCFRNISRLRLQTCASSTELILGGEISRKSTFTKHNNSKLVSVLVYLSYFVHLFFLSRQTSAEHLTITDLRLLPTFRQWERDSGDEGRWLLTLDESFTKSRVQTEHPAAFNPLPALL